jgi:hypothetical protein
MMVCAPCRRHPLLDPARVVLAAKEVQRQRSENGTGESAAPPQLIEPDDDLTVSASTRIPPRLVKLPQRLASTPIKNCMNFTEPGLLVAAFVLTRLSGFVPNLAWGLKGMNM